MFPGRSGWRRQPRQIGDSRALGGGDQTLASASESLLVCIRLKLVAVCADIFGRGALPLWAWVVGFFTTNLREFSRMGGRCRVKSPAVARLTRLTTSSAVLRGVVGLVLSLLV